LDSLAVYRFATDDHTHHTGTCNTYLFIYNFVSFHVSAN
jgi:hypothetical protein